MLKRRNRNNEIEWFVFEVDNINVCYAQTRFVLIDDRPGSSKAIARQHVAELHPSPPYACNKLLRQPKLDRALVRPRAVVRVHEVRYRSSVQVEKCLVSQGRHPASRRARHAAVRRACQLTERSSSKWPHACILPHRDVGSIATCTVPCSSAALPKPPADYHHSMDCRVWDTEDMLARRPRTLLASRPAVWTGLWCLATTGSTLPLGGARAISEIVRG